jgi:hypothetical protein
VVCPLGKTIGIAGEQLTGADMAAAFARALGEQVRYNDVSPYVYPTVSGVW